MYGYGYDWQQDQEKRAQDYALHMEKAEKDQKINRLARAKLAKLREGLRHGTRAGRRMGGKKRLWRFAKRSATREANGLKVPKPTAFVEIGGANNHVAAKKPRKRAAAKKTAKAQTR